MIATKLMKNTAIGLVFAHAVARPPGVRMARSTRAQYLRARLANFSSADGVGSGMSKETAGADPALITGAPPAILLISLLTKTLNMAKGCRKDPTSTSRLDGCRCEVASLVTVRKSKDGSNLAWRTCPTAGLTA
ncbi:hypothetical protein N656DRAFT_261006 [Canariomyces notabilis]|uniref:Uncharacterized protein n=1 Tax=Canariomyces notabilis TaxID=2074819 RepID=A0AAN6YWG5_9PEZI|nr:hypothetical protein N656DRAFT_261006 [Canariomyces arenarius]